MVDFVNRSWAGRALGESILVLAKSPIVYILCKRVVYQRAVFCGLEKVRRFSYLMCKRVLCLMILDAVSAVSISESALTNM